MLVIMSMFLLSLMIQVLEGEIFRARRKYGIWLQKLSFVQKYESTPYRYV